MDTAENQEVGQVLKGMSLTELRQLERELPKQIDRVEREERRIAFQAVEKAAVQAGLTKSDLLGHYGGSRKGAAAKVTTGFRHPETGQVWAGRGRRPHWVNEFEAKGGDLAAIEIRPGS